MKLAALLMLLFSCFVAYEAGEVGSGWRSSQDAHSAEAVPVVRRRASNDEMARREQKEKDGVLREYRLPRHAICNRQYVATGGQQLERSGNGQVAEAGERREMHVESDDWICLRQVRSQLTLPVSALALQLYWTEPPRADVRVAVDEYGLWIPGPKGE